MPKLRYLFFVALSAILSNIAYADNALLAIIIDDIGYNKPLSERAANLNGAFTLSILPFTPHGAETAQLAHQHGKELMLHLPMSTINNMPVGKGGLVSGMTKNEFLTTLQQDLNSIANIQGVNNHMGSLLTQEAEPMYWLMTELRTRHLYFVDSRTSAKTKAFDIAQQQQIPSLKRDVFLDDIKDPDAIEYQLNRAFKLAKKNGQAIAIGHPYPVTLGVLEHLQSLLERQHVTLVYLSELLPQKAKDADILAMPTLLDEPPFCSIPSGESPITPHQNITVDTKIGIINWIFFGY